MTNVEIGPTVLQRPADTTALMERMMVLSRLRLQSFAQRTELVGLVTLQIEGSITANNIWELLLGFYQCTPSSDDVWLNSVRRDHISTWNNLAKLVACETLPEDNPEEQAEEWLRSVMRTLDTVAGDSSKILPGWKVADALPGMLFSEVERRSFGSPDAIGEALARHISSFGSRDQGARLLDILAKEVIRAVSKYQEGTDASGRTTALSCVEIWWLFLMGMTSGTMHSRNAPTMLNWDVVDRIDLALRSGLGVLGGNGDQTAYWGGSAGQSTIADLIARLRKRVTDEKARQVGFKNYR